MKLWQNCNLPIKPHGRDARERLEKELKSGPGRLWVAEADGQIVGAVLATHDFRKGWINHLAVDRSMRRRGLGMRLAKIAQDYLRNDCNLLISAILIEGDNPESHALFSRLGFKPHPDIRYYALRTTPEA
jgi:ribosomal protein S18 acetylase RimI-like enzyme